VLTGSERTAWKGEAEGGPASEEGSRTPSQSVRENVILNDRRESRAVLLAI
jgi:hypothetical protein